MKRKQREPRQPVSEAKEKWSSNYWTRHRSNQGVVRTQLRTLRAFLHLIPRAFPFKVFACWYSHIHFPEEANPPLVPFPASLLWISKLTYPLLSAGAEVITPRQKEILKTFLCTRCLKCLAWICLHCLHFRASVLSSVKWGSNNMVVKNINLTNSVNWFM